MEDTHQPEKANAPSYVIFTDLDGTLLDPHSYTWKPAGPALALCKRLGVPVILASSKTRAEMEVLRHQMGLSTPFIPENGGAIYFPKPGVAPPPEGALDLQDTWKLSLGTPYWRLVESLKEIREELGLQIRGFSNMSLDEISRLTGLGKSACKLAIMREFDEPILVHENSPHFAAISHAAWRRGVKVVPGGRFCHLQGKNDKGQAVRILISWYKAIVYNVRTIALGDSPNDLEMLRVVDFPVLIRSQSSFVEMQKQIPAARISTHAGPEGWNHAVLDILSGLTE
ncbi:MAG: HAD-IIB family hydrolase [Deltaproteobacteria bacterium]|nr:HAD-IIB family hydrolase [Deltaproteobacteria bacterium]